MKCAACPGEVGARVHGDCSVLFTLPQKGLPSHPSHMGRMQNDQAVGKHWSQWRQTTVPAG